MAAAFGAIKGFLHFFTDERPRVAEAHGEVHTILDVLGSRSSQS